LRRSPPHTKDCRSGVCGSRMTCLGPGRKGMEITFGRRDARGLTFSVVIPARVLQPGISTRRKQKWRMALCGYGMRLALRHQVHGCGSHRWRTSAAAPAQVLTGRTLWEGEERVGSRASPQLQSTPLFEWRWPAGVPVPVPPETQSAHLSAQQFTGFPITIAVESGVPLAQPLLGTGIGADLVAAIPASAWGGAIGDGG
jgi:hypothetical protein